MTAERNAEIYDMIGKKHLRSLIENFPGIKLFVPKKKISENHPLFIVLGEDGAREVMENFGGDAFAIPKKMPTQTQERNRELIEAYKAGGAVTQLALDFDLTERRVYQILKEVCAVGEHLKTEDRRGFVFRQRRIKVCKEFRRGRSPKQIATKLKLNPDYVREILRRES